MARVALGALLLALSGCGSAAPATKPAPGPVGKASPARREPAPAPAPDIEPCEAYGRRVQGWFEELGVEWKYFQKRAPSDGAPAFRRLGRFLVAGAATLSAVEADGELGVANRELVAAFAAMGAGFIEVADRIDAKDQPGAQVGVARIQASGRALGAAFERLKKACSVIETPEAPSPGD